MQNKTPLFVLGNPRSGTSLFRLMLTNHREIVVPPECGFIQWWYSKYNDWKAGDEQGNRLDDYLKDLMTSKKMHTWELDVDSLKNRIISTIPASYSELSLLVIEEYASKFDKSPLFLGDKNNYYIDHLDLLNSLFPDAVFLHIIRDVRDVACSYKNVMSLDSASPLRPNLPVNAYDIAIEWNNNNTKILEFSDSISSNRFYSVRYEDIVNNSEVELSKICEFLDIHYDANMLEYYSEKNEREPQDLIAWKEKTLQEPDKSNVSKYLNILDSDEITTFNETSKVLLRRFNYL